jgi:hypothetical protein
MSRLMIAVVGLWIARLKARELAAKTIDATPIPPAKIRQMRVSAMPILAASQSRAFAAFQVAMARTRPETEQATAPRNSRAEIKTL